MPPKMSVAPHGPRVAVADGDGFGALLRPGAIRALFQPIVRLSDLEPIGYEGLARFPSPPGHAALPPDVTLAAAEAHGLRGPLEAACWAAIAEAGVPPADRLLFVNVSPHLIGQPGFAEIAGRLPSRLVIELTEQDAISDVGTLLREGLRPWLSRGALVAIDDAGSGFSPLEYVAEIRPDFLKLSRGMIAGVERDAGRQSVLRATVAFAREVGARIVAEGVERPEELRVLREAGIDYGQGWLFGRPAQAWPDGSVVAAVRAPRPAAVPTDPLARAVAAAGSVDAAAGAVCDHLAGRGLLPSVYLEQGGRLRCRALRGYWQLCDGIPPSAGLIGRCLRTGQTVREGDARCCVPLRVGDTVAGVLGAECTAPPTGAELSELERAAGLLGARIGALGGVEAPSPAQRLARTLTGLAALDDPEDIVRETVAAARALAGFESAVLALADGEGRLHPHHAEGPLAVALGELDAGELARMGEWVDHGTSCYTTGDAGGRAFAGHEPLRRAGADSLAVLPMRAAGERMGVLVLADRAPRRLSTETAELLELLAVQAGCGLRLAAAVLEPR